MKFLIPLFAAVSSTSAHYIMKTLIVNGQSSTAAVRTPAENSPVLGINDPGMACNVNTAKATETVSVAAGSNIGFRVDPSFYHKGTGALYLGQAPGSAADWDGSGARWFKIADFGATFNPFKFVLDGATEMQGTIPADIPAGEYLIRGEHTALHAGKPEWYISCAQIKVTGGGNGSPSLVSIPGHLQASDPGLTTDIYYPVPASWTMPGPAVYVSGNGNGNNTPPAPPPPPSVPSGNAPSYTPDTPVVTPSKSASIPSQSAAVPPPATTPAPPKSCKAKFKRHAPVYGTRLPRAAMGMHKRQH